MQSAYIIFKMFSLRLKLNLRKPDVFKFTRFEAGICDERLPEVPRSYDFRVRVSHAHTLTGRGKSPFRPLRSRCFVSAWVLDLRKITG